MSQSTWDEVEVAGGGLKAAGFRMISSCGASQGYAIRGARFSSTVCEYLKEVPAPGSTNIRIVFARAEV